MLKSDAEYVILSSKSVDLILEIDTAISPVMEYFEIFLGRMLLCRKAADRLGIVFGLVINSQRII